MPHDLTSNSLGDSIPRKENVLYKRLWLGLGAACAVICACFLNGCQTRTSPASMQATGTPTFTEKSTTNASKSEAFVLHEGDTVRVTFPGAPSLNTAQQIRRDGRITLPQFGEFKAAGLTPANMQKELLDQFGAQLQTKEILVSVDSSAFPIYVTGAVLRPGRVVSDRPPTVLQAIVEAGGFDYNRANLKKVRIIRTENGQTQHYTLDLKNVLQGGQAEQFKLKPSDVIYVPDKFTWF